MFSAASIVRSSWMLLLLVLGLCALAATTNAQQALDPSVPTEALVQQQAQKIRQRSSSVEAAETSAVASSSLSSLQPLSSNDDAAGSPCRVFLEEALREMEGRLKAQQEQTWEIFQREQSTLSGALTRLDDTVGSLLEMFQMEEHPQLPRRHLQANNNNTATAIKQLQKRVKALETRLDSLEQGTMKRVHNRVQTLEDDVDELARLLAESTSEQEQATFCGCASCTTSVWRSLAPANFDPNFTCGSRISYLQNSGMSNLDACRVVARDQHPTECAQCNPDTCNNADTGGTAGVPAPVPATGRTPAPTWPPHTPPLTATTPMYCFPDYNLRQRFTGVFNQNFVVETKEGMCGPGNNLFTTRTVSLAAGGGLKLQYKKVGGGWEASEVRIVLPANQMPFSYGTYKFSVKSVSTIDSTTGQVVSSKLSKDLVLGMFTWDTTDRFDVREAMNHEVDVEISQWGIDGNADVQFVVQPPEQPHYHRFFSGPGNTYSPGGKTYEFTWNPTSIVWRSSSGETHTYTTEMALASGLVDYVQCLPADVEVRMNIWNKNGAVAPAGMADNHVAEVIIDSFTYTPSNVKGVANGQACSKHCQCRGTSQCVNSVCTAA